MAQSIGGQWSYPLEETNGNARRPPKRSDVSGSQERGQSAYRETKAMRPTPSEAYNVMSDSEEVKQRRVSLKANNSTTSRKRSRNTLRGTQDTRPDYVDDSAWIHRDKLAEIEIQELEEAGIYVRPSRRSMSQGPPGASRRSSRSASRSRMPINDESLNEPIPDRPYNVAYGDYKDKPLPSTPVPHDEDREFNPDIDTEFRTPEEVAAEYGAVRTQVPRPSTSRIPISKMSPVPVPSTVIGRDSPLPRSRHGSGPGSGNWDEMQYRRARSSSIGSQAILDEDAMRTPPASGSSNKMSSTENSPPKARVPSKATPKSGARKGSTPSNEARPGSSYGKNSASSQRPTSRAGSGQKSARPSTSHQHAPEGDPPWIDSMYKPDPRLPPDQQMLPTHAKRMMQEQWEKEGKSGTSYDRDLNPLATKELPSPKPKPKSLNLSPTPDNHSTRSNSPSKLSQRWQQGDSATTPNLTNIAAWPLTPKGEHDETPPTPSRPGTSRGLKLTPRVPTPPPIERSPNSPQVLQAQPQTSLRVPDVDEKQEPPQKKGCLPCCVVM